LRARQFSTSIPDEQVRIEVRLADEGGDLAAVRSMAMSAAPVAEQLLDQRLQADVDRQALPRSPVVLRHRVSPRSSRPP
jgi:hypothetical protein